MKILIPALLVVLCTSPFSTALAAANSNAAAAKKVVLENLKDPESARFGAFTIATKNTACLTVNAKNSMGGYTGKQEAALSKIKGKWYLLGFYEVSHAQCVATFKNPPKKTAVEDIDDDYLPSDYDEERTADTANDIKALAQQGDPAYQYRLGRMYLEGKEVTKNKTEGIKWLKAAGNQGHLKAQQLLAQCYAKGQFTAKNPKEAMVWLRKASENDDTDAIKQLAELGDPVAQNLVGLEYCKEHGSVYYESENEAEAVKWFRKSAAQGNREGQYNLGERYDRGEGVGENKAEAKKWYEKAAAQGEPNAMLSLAVYYRDGIGVPEDREKALSWARKAATNGNAAAESLVESLSAPPPAAEPATAN